MSVSTRNNVTVSGRGARPILFAHGYGCDQQMWRLVAPAFEDSHRVILFDHVGSGRSDVRAYCRAKYSSLQGYADDVLEICRELDLHDVVFVGHSVGAMVGVLAVIQEPERFSGLVLVGPSPRYLDDDEYVGGFSRQDIDDLLAFQDSNYLGWASHLGRIAMANPDRPELAEELTNSFCRTDPAIARQFAAVTFLSDNRADLSKVQMPCLILQCRDDIIAPVTVGKYVQRQIPRSRLVLLEASGHCPHLSAPDETAAAIRAFLEG